MSAKKTPVTPIFMDLPTVAQAVALSTSTIERLEREGQFPKRRQLSGQRVGWLVREVQEGGRVAAGVAASAAAEYGSAEAAQQRIGLSNPHQGAQPDEPGTRPARVAGFSFSGPDL